MDRRAYLETIKHHLKTAYLLSEEKTETMIPVFVATLHAHMNRLAELADAGDVDQLARACHAAKGALLNMGLNDLADTASVIEQHCKNGNTTSDYRFLITDLAFTVAQFSED